MKLESKFGSGIFAFPIGIGVIGIPYIIAESAEQARRHYQKIKSRGLMMADCENFKENNYLGEYGSQL